MSEHSQILNFINADWLELGKNHGALRTNFLEKDTWRSKKSEMSWFYTNQGVPTIVLWTLPEPWDRLRDVTHARCKVPQSSRPEALGVGLKPLHFTEVKQGHRDHPADGRPGASGAATGRRHPLHSDWKRLTGSRHQCPLSRPPAD